MTTAGIAALTLLTVGMAIGVRGRLHSRGGERRAPVPPRTSRPDAPAIRRDPVASPLDSTQLGGVPPEERVPGAGVDRDFYDRRGLMVSKTVSFDGGVAMFVRPKGALPASTPGAIPVVELRFHDASAGATLEALLVGEGSPSGQKRVRCFQELGSRLGYGPRPGRWNIHLRASAKEGSGQVEYLGPVAGKWPPDFDLEAQRCVEGAYQGITFSADHDFQYDLDHEQCIGGRSPHAPPAN